MLSMEAVAYFTKADDARDAETQGDWQRAASLWLEAAKENPELLEYALLHANACSYLANTCSAPVNAFLKG